MKAKQLIVMIGAAVLILATAGAGELFSLPEVDEVQKGAIDIQMTDPGTMTINATDKAIVNYKSFDIMPNESVIINLPSADSQILNRVVGPGASQILGNLSSNGIIILINQSGIYVGPSANINAASVILSTRDISNDRFINGEYLFQKISKEQLDTLLLNEGSITVQNGGFCALIAGAIENRGLIQAKVGTIALAAGNVIRLELAGNKLIGIAVEEAVAETVLDHQGKPVSDQIKNTGTLDAEGGTVILSASSLANVFSRLINTEGVVTATHLEERDGQVMFVADGPVAVSGKVEATNIVIGDIAHNIVPENVKIGEAACVRAEEMISIDARGPIEVDSLIQAPMINLTSGGGIDTTNAAIIQGQNVSLTANRFGKSETPVNIQADRIRIKRSNGDIDIRESVGIGSSVWIRGPPEGGAINIFYNKNVSQLTFEGRSVITSGNQAQDVQITAINLSIYAAQIDFTGIIDASCKVELIGLEGATLGSGSCISVPGGRVEILGKNVQLVGAKIDVSGVSGGGMVLIGGDFQGKGTVQNAATTYVSRDTYIYANATGMGNGGTVIIWSNESTVYHGHISAQGGPEGGNGGFVQVSGAQKLEFNGFVDATAPAGDRGTFILDPAGTSGYAASLATDLLDYKPGEIVTITGSGWQPGETVSLVLHPSLDTIEDITLTAVADANGNFSNASFSTQEYHRGVVFVLGATGQSSVLVAESRFTDATRTSTAAGGNWATGGTWVGGTAPVATDDVVIATTGAGAVTTSAGTITCNSLTINAGATLTMYRQFTVTTTTSISGTINFGSTSGTVRNMTFTGAVTLNSGAVWNETTTGAAATFSFGNSLTNNATTFTAQNTAHNFTGSGRTISGSTATVIPTVTFTGNYTNSGTLTVSTLLTVTGAAIRLTNNGTITASTALSGTGGVTQGATGILNIGGTSAITTLDASTNAGNTVNYTGAAQTVHSNNYYNLTLSGSLAKTLQAGTTTIGGNLTLSGTATTTTVVGLAINGNLAIGDGTTFTAAGFALTVTGTTTIGGGTSGNLIITSATGTKIFNGLVTVNCPGLGGWNNSGNSPITLRGGITNSGTSNNFAAGSGVYTFDTNPQALSGPLSIPSVTVTGVTLTNNGDLAVATALAGTGELVNGAICTLNIGGTSGITTLTATAVGNTVNYNGAAQTVHSNNYYNLTLSGSLAKTLQAGTTTIGGNLTLSGTATTTTVVGLAINGNLAIGDGTTFTAAAFPLTVTGTTTVGGGTSGILTIFSATGTKAFNGDVIVNNGGTWNNTAGNAALTLPGSITNNGTFNAGTGVHTLSGTGKTISGTISIPSVTVSGTYTNNGTLTVGTALAGAGGLTNSATGILNIGGTSTITTLTATAVGNTVNYNGAAQTVFSTNYYNLTLSGSLAKTLQAGTTTIGGNLTLSGTATTTTVAGLAISGNLSIGNGTTFTAAGFPLTVTGTTTVGTGTSGNLTISSATGAKTFTGLVTVSAGGVWNNSGNSPVTLQGGLTNNGTFTSGTGLYTFNTNSQAIGGTSAVTFSGNVAIAGDITVTNNQTVTINGNLDGSVAGSTWTNANGSTLNIAGSLFATAGTLNASTATNTVNYNGSSPQTIIAANYYNLTSSSTGGRTLASSGTIGVAGTFTPGTNAYTITGSTVDYNGGVQTVAGINYNNLVLSGSGAKTLQVGTTTIGGNLTLSGTATTTTVVGLAINGNLAIGDGTTFTAAGFALTVTGTTTIGGGTSGNLIITSATGTKIFSGLVTVNCPGLGGWNNSGNSPITLRGGITNSGTTDNFAAGSGVYTFDTNPQALSGALSIPSVTVTGVTLTNNGDLAVATALAGTGELVNGATRTLNIGGTSGITTLTATAVGNTVNYNGAAAQTVKSTSYYNLDFSGAGTKTTPATLTIAGNWAVGSAAALNTNNTVVNLTGDLTGTGAITQGTGAINIGGNWTHSGTCTLTSAGVNYNSGIAQTVSTTPSYSNLTFSGAGTKTTASGTLTVGGDWIVNSPADLTTNNTSVTLTGSAKQIAGSSGITVNTLTVNGTYTNNNTGGITVSTSLSGSGTLTQGANAILNIGGTSGITGLTATASGNTVNYTGASAQTVKSASYYNLGFSGARTTNSITINGAVGIAGALTNSATFSSGNFVLTGSTITFNGSGDQTIPSLNGVSYVNLAFSGGGTKTLGAAAAVTTAFTVNSGVTFDPDVYVLSGAGTFTLSGTAIVPGATFAANYTIAGTKTINAGSTFIYENANPTINAGITYQNLAFTGTGTAGASGALAIQGDLTNTGGGTLNFGANNVSLSGTVTANSIAGFTTTGAVSMTKTGGTATFTGNVNGGALTINGTGGTLNLGTGLTHTFTGTWTRTAGTLNGGSSTINFSLAGTVFSGTGGTFTANTGTVVYSNAAAQTFPALTYYNLTLSGGGVKTVATTPTVNNILSMEGAATITVTTGVVTYGANAALQYNTATNRTVSSEEWIATFNGTGGVIIANTGIITLNAAKTFNNGITVPITVNSGATLSLGGYGLTFTTTSRAVVNNGTIKLNGNEAFTNVSNLDIDSGLVQYVGTAGPYTIKDFGTGTDYYDVQFVPSTGNPTLTSLLFNLANNLVVAHDLTVTRATVAQGAYTVTISGSLSIASGGYYTKATGGQAITFNGTSPSTLSDYNTYSDLGVIVLAKTSAAPADNKLTLNSSVIVDTLTVNANNTLDLGSSRYVLTIANAGAAANVLIVNGTFTAGISTVKFTATNSAGSINVPNLAYDSLQFSGAETYVLTGHQDSTKALTGDVAIDSGATLDFTASNYNLSCQDLTIKAGATLTGRASTITVGANWYGFGTFTMGTSTVNFTLSSGLQSLYAGGVGTGHQFYDLTHSGGGILQLNESGLYVSHNLTNSNGSLEINGNGLTVVGTFSNSGGILRLIGFETVSLTNDTSAGTVEYTGSGTYTGLAAGSSYYNLSFTGSGTFNLNAPVTVYGALGLQATPDFKYSRELTIDHTKVAEDLTYVPVVFVFSGFTNRDDIMSGSNYTIKFTNKNSVALSYEVESYNPATGQLIVWVKVDSLSTAQDTTLYMNYGSSKTEALDNPKDVWRDSSFDAVWHFQDLHDSSWNENDGNDHGTTSVTGMIGNGRYFDNPNFKQSPYSTGVYISTDLNLDLWLGGNGFVSMWVKPATTWTGANTDWQAPGIIGVEDNATVNDIYYGMADASGYIYTATGDTAGAKTNVAMNDNTWRYIVMTRDATSGATNMYVNGVLVSTVTSETGIKTTAFYSIGRKEDTIIGTVLYPQYYYGAIDELRISTVFKSANWILTQYNNQSNPIAFTGVGPEVTGLKPTLNCGSQNITLYGDWVNNANFNAGTGTVTFAGTSSISGTAAPAFNNIVIAGTGTLNAPSGNLTVSGDWTNDGTFNAGTGTVTFDGSYATIDPGGMGAGKAFNNVVINTTGAKTIASGMQINGTLQVDAGTMDGTADVTVKGGSVTGSGEINMSGGTFTVQGTGTFGGSGSAWTFSNITFGDGTSTTTTTKAGSNTINVNDTLAVNANTTLQAGTSDWNLIWASFLKTIAEISAGIDHSMALTEDGYVFVWGSNVLDQVGDGTTVDKTVPTQVLSGEEGGGTYLHDIAHISAGSYHNIALAGDGSVYAWGYNGYGQLGNGTTTNSSTPVKALSGAQGGGAYLHNISQISAGGFDSAAMAQDGSVYAWGCGDEGELGNGANTSSSIPVRVLSGAQGGGTYLHNISQITVGGIHMAAITQDGYVFMWGYNQEGELGNNTTTDSSVPVQVVSGAQGGGTYLHNVAGISLGDTHAIALMGDGSVYSWGYNPNGELGNGTTTDSSVPVRVLSGEEGGGSYLYGIAKIAGGAGHSLAIAQDGSVYSWGSDQYGQLGNGSTTNSSAPVKVLSGAQGGGTYLHNIDLIAAGGAQTMAVTQDSPVYAAGCNINGQLGNGTTVGAVAQIKVLSGSQAGPVISHTPLVVSGALASQTSTFNFVDVYHQVVYVTSATYYRLNINNNLPADFQLAGNIIVQDDVDINTATLFAGSYNITVGGDWTNNSGTFNAGTGIVTFNGTQAQSVISGTSPFNVVTIANYSTDGVTFADRLVTNTLNAGTGVKKILFAPASLASPHTIYVSFNVSGSAGNLIELAPTNSVWYLNAPTSSISYVSVSGSHQADGKTITATNSVDLGGNTNWNISN